MKKALSARHHRRGLFLIFALGIIICVWQLGNTGLVDETPPLFAAASRAMGRTGDWLTPRVNGLPRFDKPPLVYWLMGLGFSLPGQDFWDPLGTWSARLPSALSTVLMMLVLGDTAMRWPQKEDSSPLRTGVVISLVFALSPLVMIWSRIAVSDALLTSTLGVSLLLHWRRYVNPENHCWWLSWILLGLAVLTKGPVAVVLTGITLFSFGFLQRDFITLCKRLRPLWGLLLTALVSLPWYIIELIFEGKPFWDSFFGYHNFQRLTSVVNSHYQPWWFFVFVGLIASLPFTPFLILGIIRVITSLNLNFNSFYENKKNNSLFVFSLAWLIAVFLLFTIAATKLPSYWLPATPAAALLVGFASVRSKQFKFGYLIAWWGSVSLILILSLILWTSNYWLPFINDHEMPSMADDLIASKIPFVGALLLSFSAFLGLIGTYRRRSSKFLLLQAPLFAFHLFVFLPIVELADNLRQKPIREAAKIMVSSKKANEPFAMVGATKPSLHFYTDEIIFYEGRSLGALVNLVERVYFNERNNLIRNVEDKNNPKIASNSILILIDKSTLQKPHWRDLNPDFIGQYGIYKVMRFDRSILRKRADQIIKSGINPDWRVPRPEKI